MQESTHHYWSATPSEKCIPKRPPLNPNLLLTNYQQQYPTLAVLLTRGRRKPSAVTAKSIPMTNQHASTYQVYRTQKKTNATTHWRGNNIPSPNSKPSKTKQIHYPFPRRNNRNRKLPSRSSTHPKSTKPKLFGVVWLDATKDAERVKSYIRKVKSYLVIYNE